MSFKFLVFSIDLDIGSPDKRIVNPEWLQQDGFVVIEFRDLIVSFSFDLW